MYLQLWWPNCCAASRLSRGAGAAHSASEAAASAFTPGLLNLDLPDHVPIGVQLEVEPDDFLAPEAAHPAHHWFTAPKGLSRQRQPVVPSSWMCSMNSGAAGGPVPVGHSCMLAITTDRQSAGSWHPSSNTAAPAWRIRQVVDRGKGTTLSGAGARPACSSLLSENGAGEREPGHLLASPSISALWLTMVFLSLVTVSRSLFSVSGTWCVSVRTRS